MTETTLTKERDVRISRPLWVDTPRTSVRSSAKPVASAYDAIIVGGGISGALVAHALCQDGKSVLIADRREPVKGSSIASTAMIQHEIDIPLSELQKMIGVDHANRAWKRSARAVLRLEEIVKSLGISCGMRRKKALYLAGDEMGHRAFQVEAKARQVAGIEAQYLDVKQLRDTYGLDRTGAILSDISASANPGQLTAGLLRDVARRGAEIVSGVEITDLKSADDEVILATSQGQLLSARHVVFCTGYEFLKALDSNRQEIISTWALATRPGLQLPDWLQDHIVWEASDPYLYMRTDRDGRLIAGGEDESDPEAYRSTAKLDAKTTVIRKKLTALLGIDIPEPEYRWAAAFGSTTTGLPIIGPVPEMPRVFSVMGFGGNGITFSQIAAELIAAAINGTEDPDAELFRPG